MSKKRPESALIIIHAKSTSRVLLMERKDWPGFWQSVTGSLEPGETPEQAAKRELNEETGLQATDGLLVDRKQINQYQIFDAFLHKYPPGQKTNKEYVFTFELDTEKDIKMTEHTDMCWLPKADAIEKAFTQTDKKAIEDWVQEGT